jgi:hypothetical protein
MRRRGVRDHVRWSGRAPSVRAAFVGALQGALLCAAAHAVFAAAAVLLKAAFSVAAPPSPADFLLAATVVALSAMLCALIFGAPLLLVLGRLNAGGALTFASCGAAAGFGATVFTAWTWPPFQFGLALFMAWYAAASAAFIWWRTNAVDRFSTDTD